MLSIWTRTKENFSHISQQNLYTIFTTKIFYSCTDELWTRSYTTSGLVCRVVKTFAKHNSDEKSAFCRELNPLEKQWRTNSISLRKFTTSRSQEEKILTYLQETNEMTNRIRRKFNKGGFVNRYCNRYFEQLMKCDRVEGGLKVCG